MRDLVIDYGIIRAVKGINLDVNEGKIVAILGANGAGKSTLIKSISGATRVKSGSITFDGLNITNKDPHRITAKGILQSPEGRMIFVGLTVEENLKVGAYSLKPEMREVTLNGETKTVKISVKKQIEELLKEVYAYFPILGERKKQQASTLSGGEQQMLAIGRALMGKPKLLLLDEPSLGLAPLIVRDIFEIIEQIKKRGKTILIVEQNAYQTLKIADYAYLLELGLVKKQGTGQELMQDEELVNAYLGTKK
ncbi:MAG: ABC transporter ATP-binding protein [Tenericutes bacterium HGW-Tenericutes-3]|nr:MAG: ABC transporter ATP-binding protein [Tenericutes bacterium HGW-Tenericutes-3]